MLITPSKMCRRPEPPEFFAAAGVAGDGCAI